MTFQAQEMWIQATRVAVSKSWWVHRTLIFVYLGSKLVIVTHLTDLEVVIQCKVHQKKPFDCLTPSPLSETLCALQTWSKYRAIFVATILDLRMLVSSGITTPLLWEEGRYHAITTPLLWEEGRYHAITTPLLWEEGRYHAITTFLPEGRKAQERKLK